MKHLATLATLATVATVATVAALLIPAGARADEPYITVASTTSTEQSGLFGYLLPRFKEATGISVHVVALGTGQALDVARRGDADVVFVHDREAEMAFLAAGDGVERHDVMYNDFVIVGPKDDPAHITGCSSATGAFAAIAHSGSPFVSRGDRSGTNFEELRLWKAAAIDPHGQPWYKDTGTGMGPALNIASAMGAYILSDRGTWLNFHNRQDLTILCAGDKALFNQYGVMLVNPAKHPATKVDLGRRFIAWLISPEGQNVIRGYRINGEELFFPDAK